MYIGISNCQVYYLSMYTSIRILLVLVTSFFFVGCQSHPVMASPVASVITESPTTNQTRQLQPIPQQATTPTPTSTCSSDRERLPQHTVVADITYPQRTINIQQMIRYTNTTGVLLEQIVLNVAPNRWRNVFTLNDLRIDNQQAQVTLDGKRLDMPFETPLEPDCTVYIALTYQLDMPLLGADISARNGYFGYTNRQLNLGHWLATVAPRRHGAWVSQQAFAIGEQDVLEKANWDVTLSVIGTDAPPIIAAPGQVTALNPTTWRYVHNNSREFSLSISIAFNVISGEADNGVIVEVYSFDDALVTVNGVQHDTAAHALEVSIESFQMYSDLFGVYPYERLLVVQGDFPDGMEFSGMVFVGSSWFTRYPGNPASYLTLITVHEVAHQWWYTRVGNDAAFDPWLDEALATYSEYIYLEEYYPELRDWWWQFRVDTFAPSGFVDSDVYQFDTARAYINAVYLRGARMLHLIRRDIGTEAFFDLLNAYSETANEQIATGSLFWSLLTPEQLALTAETRNQFLRQPQVMP